MRTIGSVLRDLQRARFLFWRLPSFCKIVAIALGPAQTRQLTRWHQAIVDPVLTQYFEALRLADCLALKRNLK